ncbi:hypothetical protein Hanom_Chr03g00233621 [Helianthus anomalus]
MRLSSWLIPVKMIRIAHSLLDYIRERSVIRPFQLNMISERCEITIECRKFDSDVGVEGVVA